MASDQPSTRRRSLRESRDSSVGLVGIGLGLLGAFWASRLLSQFLFGIEAWDLGTCLAMAAALLVLSALASYLPARRTGRVSPMEVLREE